MNLSFLFDQFLTIFKSLYKTPIGKMLLATSIAVLATILGLTLTLYYFSRGTQTTNNQIATPTPLSTPIPTKSQNFLNLDNNQQLPASEEQSIVSEAEINHRLLIKKDYSKLYDRISDSTKKSISPSNFERLIQLFLGNDQILEIKLATRPKYISADTAAFDVEVTTFGSQAAKKTFQEQYKKEAGIWKLLLIKAF